MSLFLPEERLSFLFHVAYLEHIDEGGMRFAPSKSTGAMNFGPKFFAA